MHFEHFQVAIHSLDREWAIHQGAAREIRTRSEKGKKKAKGKGQNTGGHSRAAARVPNMPNESQPLATSYQTISNHRTSGPSGLLRNLFASRMESCLLPLEAATNLPTFNPYVHHNIRRSEPLFHAYRQYGVQESGAMPGFQIPISSSQFSNLNGVASGSSYQAQNV